MTAKRWWPPHQCSVYCADQRYQLSSWTHTILIFTAHPEQQLLGKLRVIDRIVTGIDLRIDDDLTTCFANKQHRHIETGEVVNREDNALSYLLTIGPYTPRCPKHNKECCEHCAIGVLAKAKGGL